MPRRHHRVKLSWSWGTTAAVFALLGAVIAGFTLINQRMSTGGVDGISVVAVLLGFAAAGFAIYIAWSEARHRPPQLTLVEKVERLRSSLKSSSDLIREVNADFDLQVAAAEKIKAEAEQNRRLAELNEEQARAVKELVESVQGRASEVGGRQQWLFFLAGLLFSVPLGVVGNFVFELVKTWLATQ